MLLQSIWVELADYLERTFVHPRFPYFYHLSNRTEGYKIILIIAAVFIGVLAAGTIYVYQKRVIGAFPRALLAGGAVTEERALSVQELGFRPGWLLRLSMRSPSSALRRYVRYVGEQDLSYEDYVARKKPPKPALIDYSSARFYIAEQKSGECACRFDIEKAGSWGTVAWFWAGGILLFFIICNFLPSIMSVVDWFAGIL